MLRTSQLFRFSIFAQALLVLLPVCPAQAPPQLAAMPGAIDQYLGNVHARNGLQPLAGHGDKFAREGGTYHVDPRLIVAIAGAETTYGAFVCSENNAFNWFWNSGKDCHQSPFDEWDSGIHTVTRFMNKSYLLKGYNTIPLIGAKYCASGCENWVPNVTHFYQAMGGDLSGPLTLPASFSGQGSTTTQTQPSDAAPVLTAALVQSAKSGKSLVFTVQANFTGLTSQHPTQVEVFRDGTQESIALLQRVAASPDSAPSFQGSFILPAGDAGTNLRVRGRLLSRGKSASSLTSDLLIVPESATSVPWVGIAIGGGALLLIVVIVVMIVLLRKSKPARLPAPKAAAARLTTTTAMPEPKPPTDTAAQTEASNGKTFTAAK